MHSRYLLPFLLAAFPAGNVLAGSTLAFGSSIGARNLTSTGAPLHERFVLELGCFTAGFVPTAANTAEWLEHWRAFPEGAAFYRTSVLGDPFPPSPALNSFGGSVRFTENTAPFTIGTRLYLWGFDRRTLAGKGEWVLVTDPDWICPDGQGTGPAISYAVAEASQPVLGRINEEGTEIRTEAVALSQIPESLAEWQMRQFGTADPETSGYTPLRERIADPDGDGIPNLVEFFTGADPGLTELPPLEGPWGEGGQVILRYRRSLLAAGVAGRVEWSSDLIWWSSEGVTESAVGQDAVSVEVEARVPAPVAGGAFFRLNVVE